MRIAESFTFVTKQPLGLKRHLAGTLLILVPIVGWIAAAGYTVRLLAEIRAGREKLPPWADWQTVFSLGLVFWLAWFSYNLPLLVLNRLDDGLGLLSPATVWSLIVFLILPAGLVQYVATGSLRALYRPGPILDFIRANLRSYLTAWLVTLAAFTFGFTGMAAAMRLATERGSVLSLVSFLLVSFIVFWAALAAAHLFGTVANEDLSRIRRP